MYRVPYGFAGASVCPHSRCYSTVRWTRWAQVIQDHLGDTIKLSIEMRVYAVSTFPRTDDIVRIDWYNLLSVECV